MEGQNKVKMENLTLNKMMYERRQKKGLTKLNEKNLDMKREKKREEN